MTDATALAIQPQEIVIANNEQFVYWAEYVKGLTRAIGLAEKLRTAVKDKMVAYRAQQEADRKKEETEVLRQARALNQPAVVTKMTPVVNDIHYRKKLKWRIKNLKTVPAAYKITTPDDKAINKAMKAFGKEANIRGIEVYEDEIVVSSS